MRWRLFVMLFGVVTGLAAATPDETARFLAGLPLEGTSLEAMSARPAWKTHVTEFESAWKHLETRQLEKIRAWGPEHLRPEYESAGNVFYYFSGPDQLYAQAFFPKAANYVLVAREPSGELPNLEKMSAEEFAPSLSNLRQTLNAVLSFSFFITEKMKTDLRHQQLSGTLPVILVFLARSGAYIDDVQSIWLDKDGTVAPKGPTSATHGVKITFTQPGATAPQNVYYLETDLSDEMLKRNGAALRFAESLGRGSSLVKAASHLMQGSNFQTVKKWILTQSDLIIEDDSGIPLRDFDKSKWELQYFGHYDVPIKLFVKNAQPDLTKAFKEGNPGPLGFSFGYQWQPGKSSMILARPKP